MTRRLGTLLAPILLALLFTPVPGALAAARRAAPAVCSWVQMASRNNGATANELNSVAALSASNVWSVGEYFAGSNATKTLIEHWNGKTWKIVRSPNAGTGDSLFAVYAISPANLWAVGSYYNGSTGRTLIEHWNGKVWKIVWSPNIGAGANELRSVRGTSARDIWAVGDAITSYPVSKTVILHWAGSRWQLADSPSVPSATNLLFGVRPAAPAEAWAVGNYSTLAGSKTLVLHWTKRHWRVVPSPNGGTVSNVLTGVLATSAANAWAVGYYYNGSADRTLVLHWNGRHWLKSFSPNTGPADSDDIHAIGATSPANVYAVGSAYHGAGSAVLITHWNGSHWRVLPGRNPGSGFNILNSIFALSARSIWAVGVTSVKGGPNRTLIEHCR